MKNDTFKIIAEYCDNHKKEAVCMGETPEKAIEKVIKENLLPLNFIDNLPIFWMNYDPNEKRLSINGSEQNYKVNVITKSNYERSRFYKTISSCGITKIAVEKA